MTSDSADLDLVGRYLAVSPPGMERGRRLHRRQHLRHEGGPVSPGPPAPHRRSDADCQQFSFTHEGAIQRHPRSGRVLDYVSYWDSGLRIVDVTDPAHPTEVGALDYAAGSGTCCAHEAKPTPSANWVYLEDEIGVGDTGGVHVLDTRACDGLSYCTPRQVGFWHIKGHPVQAAA